MESDGIRSSKGTARRRAGFFKLHPPSHGPWLLHAAEILDQNIGGC